MAGKLPQADVAREWLATMMLIRRFEERAGEMYARARIGGFLHLSIGEEATIVGSARALRENDYLISTYRSHGHALVRGTPPENVMAELYGRVDGCSGGRGGSMHMFDGARRFMGGYGIVGGNLPIAAGIALSSDYRGSDEVTLCVFGDGASNQGTFGETLNLAALWRLPVVFLVTNNQFGMGTALRRHSAVTDLGRKGESLGVAGMRCDGMDVVDTHATLSEAVARVREQRRPLLVEAVTYRFRGHSMADPEEYRSQEEVASWRARDPIPAFGEALVSAGVIDAGERERVDAEAIERVDAAVAFAEASPFPAAESLYDDVYVLTDQVHGWYSMPSARRRDRPAVRGRRARRGRRRARRGRRGPFARTRARAREGQRRRHSDACPAGGRRRRDPAPADARAGGRRGRRPRRASGRRLMAQLRYREALRAALAEELERDERVFVMGEDVGVFGGAFKVTAGLLERFGERRVRDTPISENTIVGAGVGAAMSGLRPVVELMTINFSLLAFDQIVNHAAAIHYMFGGQATVPLVVRMPQGAGHQLGPTHSHCLEAMFLHVPGLLVAAPATPADAKGLLKAAIRDDNPVIFIEHESLYGVRGEVPDDPERIVGFGRARVAREGSDVTIVGVSRMALTAERAAQTLADEHGAAAEVVDPRTLRPLDLDTILASVAKTSRCVIVEEGWPHGGVGANLAALVGEQAFDDLDAPVQRVGGADVPMPYSKPLEEVAYPHEAQVVAAALATLGETVGTRA
jgi:pyruvate dehydrogenase E1 component alpha subunit